MREPYLDPGFATRDNKGFHIKFSNGWVVSCQFGPGNYCEHYYKNLDFSAPIMENTWKSPDAELWAWNTILNIYLFNDPTGWNSPADLMAILSRVAYAPTPVYYGA